MSKFGGLRKHEKTEHALVGLGCAAQSCGCCSHAQVRRPEFPDTDNKVYLKKEGKKRKEKKERSDDSCLIPQ